MSNEKKILDSFDKWIATKEGVKLLKSLATNAKSTDQEYIRNCLWWAYRAGQQSGDVLPTDAGDIVRWCAEDKYKLRVPRWVHNSANYILKNLL